MNHKRVISISVTVNYMTQTSVSSKSPLRGLRALKHTKKLTFWNIVRAYPRTSIHSRINQRFIIRIRLVSGEFFCLARRMLPNHKIRRNTKEGDDDDEDTDVVTRSRGSSVSIVSDCWLDGPGSIPDRRRGFFLYPLRPDRLWGPPSLL
jgi:hypothetical protein